MAPLPVIPAAMNAHLVRAACELNSVKIPAATCDAEVEDAATGRVPGHGWWRVAGGVAGTGFAALVFLQAARRTARLRQSGFRLTQSAASKRRVDLS
jgi:hypothetical protein